MAISIRLVALAAVAIATSAIAEDGYRFIESEAEYKELLVDKWIVGGDFRFISEADGDLKGGGRGQRARGSWEWRDGEGFCRELRLGDRYLPRQCQRVETNGEVFRFHRPDGTVSIDFRYE